jgi:pimeloyl-ACP methyl ester carboxylesterase
MERVAANGAELEVAVAGSGEPVVLVPTAIIADELLPLAGELALRDRYRVIRYHRRGYGGSSPVQGPGSIERDAADCRALLVALGVDQAHIVGLSYSGAVALQMALDAPAMIRSLTLLEPPPVFVPSTEQFFAAAAPTVAAYDAGDPAHAIDVLMRIVSGPDWRAMVDRRVPGASDQMERDAATFFETDWPALRAWRFRAEDARGITQPVLHIGGSESGRFFAEVRQRILEWLPQTEDVVLPGADHSLALTHAAQVATALDAFLQRHTAHGAKLGSS